MYNRTQRRFGNGETETNQLDVEEPLECEENLPQDSNDPNKPVNPELDQSCVSSNGKNLTRNINQPPMATR